MRKINLPEAKARLNIHTLWHHFGYPGDPRNNPCHSPFRDDNKPSFSVNEDGALWHDFATGEGGDAVDFFQRASGLSERDAIRKFLELAGGSFTPPPPAPRPKPKPAEAKAKPKFPDFRTGTRADFDALARLRGIGREGLEWAGERGVLWFATLHGHPAWIITDAARVNAQARRMDGLEWEHIGAKAWNLPGSGATWPIGITEARHYPAIALCEGGPDFLAAHYLTLWEQASHPSKRDVRCAPVTMLGASLNIHPAALPLFAGKRVRIFGHDDDAGKRARRRWAEQLATINVSADAFDFSGLERADGKTAKDLNDCLLLTADGFAQTERILP
jgi:hypothetical protein